MATKKHTSTAAKAESTPLKLQSVSEMNDLLFKAAKLIEYYRLLVNQDNDSSEGELSPEIENELFKMFNKASYQDVMLFRYLLETIYLKLDDESIKTADELSDGYYYLNLIYEKLES
ncbi:MAG: hypothetical protein IKG30_09425 [Clostridiales bacterium]|nr:hypothetical protein [Clostridiales bacterium]